MPFFERPRLNFEFGSFNKPHQPDSKGSLDGTSHSFEGAVKLPPTPISPRAGEVLTRWGIGPETRQQLAELTARFRYDKCDQKLRRIAAQSVLINKLGKNFYATFPDYFLDGADEYLGDCGSLSRSYLMHLEQADLFSQLNSESCLGKDRLAPAVFVGKSNTHFVGEHSRHVYTGIARIDSSNQVIEELYIDPSFQQIFAGGELRYPYEEWWYDPAVSPNSRDAAMIVGRIEMKRSRFRSENSLFLSSSPITLGVTSDFKHALEFGYLKVSRSRRESLHDPELVPFIEQITARGKCLYHYMLDGVMNTHNPDRAWVDERSIQEIRYLLGLAAQIPLHYQD